MRILITDDNSENIEAARKAAKKYSEHKFTFTTNAAKALEIIANKRTDAVITDFFFPRDNEVDPREYWDYIDDYDKGVDEVLSQLKRGSERNGYAKQIPHNRVILVDSPYAAYGGVIAKKCCDQGIPFLIVTDIYRHGKSYDHSDSSGNPAKQAAGVLLLAPFVLDGKMKASHLLSNYHPECFLGNCSKNEADWKRAIAMILDQTNGKSLRGHTKKQSIPDYFEEQLQKLNPSKTKIPENVRWELLQIQLNENGLNQGNVFLKDLETVPPNTFVALYDGTVPDAFGCIYYDQIVVFHYGKKKTQKFQWRGSQPSEDRPRLQIHELGKVRTKRTGDKTSITVEAINRKYGNRDVEFTFKKNGANSPRANKQKLRERLKKILIQTLQIKFANWQNKPLMLINNSTAVNPPTKRLLYTEGYQPPENYVPYERPKITQEEINAETGVSAFVTREQIDHGTSDDPQIRYELYVVTPKARKPRFLFEDHAYTKTEGREPRIWVKEIKPKSISLETSNGTKTIEF